MLEAKISGSIGSRQIQVELYTGAGPLVVVGPNGAGKTTLLQMILGVWRPSAGRIAVAKTTLYDSTRRIEVAVERRRLGYVPQDYALFPHLTVRENIEFASSCAPGRRAASFRDAALAALQELGLSELSERRSCELSGGEKQRVALARALAAKPCALLLDEPLAALDASMRVEVRALLGGQLQQLGLPALIVTHDPADARALGQRIAVLEAGRIVQLGTWAELCERPATPFVERFVA